MLEKFMGVLEPKSKILIATAAGYQILFLSWCVLPLWWTVLVVANTVFWSFTWVDHNKDIMNTRSLFGYGIGLIGGVTSGASLALYLSTTVSSVPQLQ